ncbi:hypothetical protein B0H10DRAFT_1942244 [Mycena sp. CBHHK59/15]|nr:hypothetical protein B0H10DRAFT_1942244 [Mycena sp. CBHHK59/15]
MSHSRKKWGEMSHSHQEIQWDVPQQEEMGWEFPFSVNLRWAEAKEVMASSCSFVSVYIHPAAGAGAIQGALKLVYPAATAGVMQECQEEWWVQGNISMMKALLQGFLYHPGPCQMVPKWPQKCGFSPISGPKWKYREGCTQKEIPEKELNDSSQTSAAAPP